MKNLLTLFLIFFLQGMAMANQTPSASQIGTNCTSWTKNLNCSMTNQQLVDNAVDQLSGTGGSAWNITDGTHTVNSVGQLTVTGGTVGGTTPNATLSITGGASQTPWTQNINGAGYQLINAGNIGVGSATPGQALDVQGTIRGSNIIDTGVTASTVMVVNSNKQLTSATNLTDTAYSTAVGANPSSTVGTSVINGSSANFMRADGAPAINLTIAPTWTGQHTFNGSPVALITGTGNVGIGSATPGQLLDVQGSVRIINGNLGIGTSNVNNNLEVVGNEELSGSFIFKGVTYNGTTGGTGNLVSANAPTLTTPAIATLRGSASSTTQVLNIQTTAGSSPTAASQMNLINTSGTGIKYAITIDNVGNVGIGSSGPQSFPLTINGNIGISTTNVASQLSGCNGSGVTSCVCKQFEGGICVSCTCT